VHGVRACTHPQVIAAEDGQLVQGLLEFEACGREDLGHTGDGAAPSARRVYRRIGSRAKWDDLARAAGGCAESGVRCGRNM
jgi:hypothetical protein